MSLFAAFSEKKTVLLLILSSLVIFGFGSLSSVSANPLTGGGTERHTGAFPGISHGPGKTRSVEQHSLVSGFINRISFLQMQYRQKIASAVKSFSQKGQIVPLLPLFFLTFIYGVLHACGPGHGKGVSMTFSLGNNQSARVLWFLGPLIAFFHAGSAVVFVLVIHAILQCTISRHLMSVNHVSQVISYSLVIILGLYLFLAGIWSLVKQKPNSCSVEDRVLRSVQGKKIRLVPVAFAIGAVPCPGVIMVLLFCFSQHQILLGLVLACIISLGMALTITLVIFLSVSGRRLLLLSSSHWQSAVHFLESLLRPCSGLCIIVIGSILLVGSL